MDADVEEDFLIHREILEQLGVSTRGTGEAR